METVKALATILALLCAVIVIADGLVLGLIWLGSWWLARKPAQEPGPMYCGNPTCYLGFQHAGACVRFGAVARTCIRLTGHDGPCNGWPREGCPGYEAWLASRSAAPCE